VNEDAPLGDASGFAVGPERTRRWRWRARGTVAAASLLTLGLGVLGFVHSPYFAADHISVEGAMRLAPEQVLRIGGIERGQNVVTLDTTAIEGRLEADPWISSASVTTDLPDTVVVRISERVPVACVPTHDGWEVVAADGVVVTTATKEPRLPTVASVVPGEDITSLGARALGAMDHSLRARVSALSVGIDGVARLVMDDGVTVSYGALDEVTSKAQALAAVLEWAHDEGVRVEQIDISVPGAPTARLAGGTLASP
jgi:cell division protein FtsQ